MSYAATRRKVKHPMISTERVIQRPCPIYDQEIAYESRNMVTVNADIKTSGLQVASSTQHYVLVYTGRVLSQVSNFRRIMNQRITLELTQP